MGKLKANPLKYIKGAGFHYCSVPEATHVQIKIPGPSGIRTLPIVLNQEDKVPGYWLWNGDTEKPTLSPSLLVTAGNRFKCHSWVKEGQVQFLGDCTHRFANTTQELLDANETD